MAMDSSLITWDIKPRWQNVGEVDRTPLRVSMWRESTRIYIEFRCIFTHAYSSRKDISQCV